MWSPSLYILSFYMLWVNGNLSSSGQRCWTERENLDHQPITRPLTASQSPGPLLPANGCRPLTASQSAGPLLPANHQAPYCQPMGAGPLLPTNGCRPLTASQSPGPLLPANHQAPYCQPITRPLTASQSPGPLLPANHQAPYCQPRGATIGNGCCHWRQQVAALFGTQRLTHPLSGLRYGLSGDSVIRSRPITAT